MGPTGSEDRCQRETGSSEPTSQPSQVDQSCGGRCPCFGANRREFNGRGTASAEVADKPSGFDASSQPAPSVFSATATEPHGARPRQGAQGRPDRRQPERFSAPTRVKLPHRPTPLPTHRVGEVITGPPGPADDERSPGKNRGFSGSPSRWRRQEPGRCLRVACVAEGWGPSSSTEDNWSAARAVFQEDGSRPHSRLFAEGYGPTRGPGRRRLQPGADWARCPTDDRAVQLPANASGRARHNGSPGAVRGGPSHRPLKTVPGLRAAAAGRLRPASEGLAKPELETGSPSGPVQVATVKTASVGPAMSGPPTTGLQPVNASSSLRSGPQESPPPWKARPVSSETSQRGPRPRIAWPEIQASLHDKPAPRRKCPPSVSRQAVANARGSSLSATES